MNFREDSWPNERGGAGVESSTKRKVTCAEASSQTEVNCWEFTGCGREKKCPAYPKYGRYCFLLTGAQVRGETQPGYKQKMMKCRKCPFYKELMTD